MSIVNDLLKTVNNLSHQFPSPLPDPDSWCPTRPIKPFPLPAPPIPHVPPVDQFVKAIPEALSKIFGF